MILINNFINTTFDNYSGILEISFPENGSFELYESAFNEIKEFIAKNDINKCLIVKNNFSDVNTDRFLLLLEDWSVQVSEQLSKNIRIAILTKLQTYRKLMIKLSWLKNLKKDYHWAITYIKVCNSEVEAKDFLNFEIPCYEVTDN